MSEVVEKVAQALHRAHYERGRRLYPDGAWDALDRFERYNWIFSARAAIEAIASAQMPVAWRVRRGASDLWGYAETESDADLFGGAGEMRYVKEPLYAALSPGEQDG